MLLDDNPKRAAPTREQVKELFARHVSSGKVRFFESAGIDFVLGRREGPYLWDLAGEVRLIDCHCNGGVFNLGHRHPELVQVLCESLQAFDIGNHHLISAQRARLAAKLAELAPGDLPYAVFGVGGGEAIDLAVKLARGATGRLTILSAKGGYHGHTGLALAAGDPRYREPFHSSAPGFRQIPFNDLEALERAVDEDTAGVLLETVPATLGMVVPDPEYLPAARGLCRERGALLILDEVQAGMGRTGRLWAAEHYGVEPDILVLGKGLSGGLFPLSATCFRADLERVFHPDPFIHISTFGGAEVGCSLALRVLEMSSDPGFLQRVSELAGLFEAGFQRLKAGHPKLLVGLRQLGLMMGIQMPDERCGPLFSRAAYEAGFLSVYANHDPRVAQFLPPLTVEATLVEELLARVDRALTGVEAALGISSA